MRSPGARRRRRPPVPVEAALSGGARPQRGLGRRGGPGARPGGNRARALVGHAEERRVARVGEAAQRGQGGRVAEVERRRRVGGGGARTQDGARERGEGVTASPFVSTTDLAGRRQRSIPGPATAWRRWRRGHARLRRRRGGTARSRGGCRARG